MNRAASLAAVALVAAGCAGSAATQRAGDSVVLAPGDRAQGRLTVPAGEATTIRLANLGPGEVDFVVRMANGVDLQSGALDTATVRFTPSKPVTMVVLLESHPGAAAMVDVAVDGAGGAELQWSFARAGR